jgi:hypothetical protein
LHKNLAITALSDEHFSGNYRYELLYIYVKPKPQIKMKKIVLTFTASFLFMSKMFAQDAAPQNLADSLRVGWWEKHTQFGANQFCSWFFVWS